MNTHPKITLTDIVRSYWNGMQGVRIVLASSIVLFIVVEVINVIIPLFYKRFFDEVSSGPFSGDLHPFVAILLTIFALNVIWWGLLWIARAQLAIGEANTIATLRQQAFSYLMRHSLDFFSNTFAGSMVSRVQRFAFGFERITDTLAFNFIPLLINIGGAVLVVMFIQPLLALILAVWALVFLALNFLYALWRLKHNIEMSEIDSSASGALADAVSNQSSTTLFAAFDEEQERYNAVTNRHAAKQKFLWNSNIAMDALQDFFVISIEFIVFFIALLYWGNGITTLGTFVLLQVYVLQIGSKINSFGRVVRNIYEVHAQATEMLEILKLPHEIADTPTAKPLVVTEGAVSLDHVAFNFNETNPVFERLSFTIPGGQKVGVVGASGAGKTTLIRLLLRLYDVTGGAIMIDGQNIQKVTQDSLRRAIAFVPQEPLLFHRSLRENIAYGKPHASDEEVVAAAKKAQAHEFIMGLQDGYDTLVGERGVKLSGGQRQRIAIARAIIKNAPILILDEATSALDSESEIEIQKALHKLMEEKTVIAIAHRLSTIKEMDRIILIENGEIVEDGSHDELVNADGTYARLWSHQAGGFLTDE